MEEVIWLGPVDHCTKLDEAINKPIWKSIGLCLLAYYRAYIFHELLGCIAAWYTVGLITILLYFKNQTEIRHRHPTTFMAHDIYGEHL